LLKKKNRYLELSFYRAAFNAGSLGYNTTVVNMSDKDGKEKMKELREKIEKGGKKKEKLRENRKKQD
jgi:hypothetical protein